VLSESPTIRELLDAAQWWQQAAVNVPEVILPLPGKKGEHAIRGEPHTPYPGQVVRLLAEEWTTNGTRRNKVQGVGLGEVLDLMLRKPGKYEPAARHMLDLTMRRLGPLLLGIFGAIRSGEPDRWKD
jgi:hypothetical protein